MSEEMPPNWVGGVAPDDHRPMIDTLEGGDWIKVGRWDWLPWGVEYEDVNDVEKLWAILDRLDWPVEEFKRSMHYRRHLDRKPWLRDL